MVLLEPERWILALMGWVFDDGYGSKGFNLGFLGCGEVSQTGGCKRGLIKSDHE